MPTPLTSALRQRRWAVISAFYVNFDLTHSEALAEAEDLQRRGQLGATVISNRAAHKTLEQNPSLETPRKTLAA